MEIILEDYHDLPFGEYEIIKIIKEVELYVKLVASDKIYYVNVPTVARITDFYKSTKSYIKYIYDGSITLE